MLNYTYKELVSSRIAIALLIILLCFLGGLKWKQYQSQKEIEKEMQDLMQQAKNLDNKNTALSQSLSYISTPDFKERLARQQLNLKKEGELVYNFADQPGSSLQAEDQVQASANLPNYKKWLNYFFSNSSN